MKLFIVYKYTLSVLQWLRHGSERFGCIMNLATGPVASGQWLASGQCAMRGRRDGRLPAMSSSSVSENARDNVPLPLSHTAIQITIIVIYSIYLNISSPCQIVFSLYFSKGDNVFANRVPLFACQQFVNLTLSRYVNVIVCDVLCFMNIRMWSQIVFSK